MKKVSEVTIEQSESKCSFIDQNWVNRTLEICSQLHWNWNNHAPALDFCCLSLRNDSSVRRRQTDRQFLLPSSLASIKLCEHPPAGFCVIQLMNASKNTTTFLAQVTAASHWGVLDWMQLYDQSPKSMFQSFIQHRLRVRETSFMISVILTPYVTLYLTERLGKCGFGLLALGDLAITITSEITSNLGSQKKVVGK